MTTLSQLTQVLRTHIWRLRANELLARLGHVAMVWTGIVVVLILVAWLTPFPGHALWVLCGAGAAVMIALGWTLRHQRQLSIWRRLDAAFAWSASVSTAAEVLQHPAHARPAVVTQQLAWTQQLIQQTPPQRVRLATWRQYAQIAVSVVVTIVAWGMPTPFDALLQQQQAVRTLAQTVSDSMQADMNQLPNQNVMLDALAGVAESQTPADLMAALSQVQNEVSQSQRDTAALQQLVRDLEAAPDDATRQQLWAAARAGGVPLDTVFADSATGSAAPAPDSAQWQEMVDAIQARAQAEQRLQRSAQAAKQAARDLEPGNANPATAEGSAPTAPNTPQSATGSPLNADSGTTSDPNQSAVLPAPGQPGASTAPGAGTTGSGRAGGGDTAAGLGEFWAQMPADAVLDLRDDSVTGQRDVMQVSQDTDPALVTQRYQALVTDARRNAQLAIQQADIPWASQPLVDAYFAALQEP